MDQDTLNIAVKRRQTYLGLIFCCPIGNTGRKEKEMAWYYGTYSCGHEGRVDLGGPTKNRQKIADWHFSRLCPECYKKHIEAEKKEKAMTAAKISAEMKLPELTGTEKQVAWANELRLKILNNLATYLKNLDKYMAEKELEFIPKTAFRIEEASNALDWFMKSKTEARYWIDIRQTGVTFYTLITEYQTHLDEELHGDAMKEIEEEETMLTVIPKTEPGCELKKGVVKFIINDSISVQYIKDTDFIDIAKKLGYKWNGTAWEKKITEYTGSGNDRVAEMANKLLLSGFTVQFPNNEAKEMAISGNFVAENDRWIKYNETDNMLSIRWKTRSDTLYDNAKKLPGAKWKDGSMRVNIEFYQEVEDFANTMGFSISNMAKHKIEEYKQEKEGFEVADVAIQNKENMTDEERITKSLKNTGTIIEDLKDE